MSLLSPKYFNLLLALCVVLLGLPANAARYTANATVDQEFFYDSNIVMGAVQIEEVEAYSLIPRLKLGVQGDAWTADLNTRLEFTKMSNQNYDSDDQFVDFSLRRFSETQAWQIDGELAREGTRSQLLDGISELFSSRTVRQTIRPSWTRVLNEKNTLSVSANGSKMKYDSTRFTDYENYGVDVNWVRQLDEQNSLTVSVYNSQFESGVAPQSVFNDPDLARSSSDTVGLTTGLTRQFNEQVTGSLAIGARRVETRTRFANCPSVPFFCQLGFVPFEPATFKSDSSGFTASGNVDYTGERWSGSVSLSRALLPSGVVGDLLESDRIAMTYARQLRPKIFFNLRLSFDSLSALDSNTYNRDYYVVTPSVRWQFAQRWSLTTSLRHRNRGTDQGFQTVTADGTAILFTVRYAHPRARWSR